MSEERVGRVEQGTSAEVTGVRMKWVLSLHLVATFVSLSLLLFWIFLFFRQVGNIVAFGMRQQTPLRQLVTGVYHFGSTALPIFDELLFGVFPAACLLLVVSWREGGGMVSWLLRFFHRLRKLLVVLVACCSLYFALLLPYACAVVYSWYNAPTAAKAFASKISFPLTYLPFFGMRISALPLLLGLIALLLVTSLATHRWLGRSGTMAFIVSIVVLVAYFPLQILCMQSYLSGYVATGSWDGFQWPFYGVVPVIVFLYLRRVEERDVIAPRGSDLSRA